MSEGNNPINNFKGTTCVNGSELKNAFAHNLSVKIGTLTLNAHWEFRAAFRQHFAGY